MYYWPERKKQRLENYNYSYPGYYFVTFCTGLRINYFGEIIDGEMILSDYGKIIHESIVKMQDIRTEIACDEYVIMPNHIHMIIIIKSIQNVGNAGMRSEERDAQQYTKNHLSNAVQWLKASVTKEIRQNYGDYEFSWQKSFHDVIIRNQEQLDKTREYIRLNPSKWEEDINNQINIKPWKK